MKALIVGADHVDPIRQELEHNPHLRGFTATEHWTGRKVGDERRKIPSGTGLVVVICDRINHQLLRNVRDQAKRRELPLLYARHSLTEIREKLAGLVLEAGH
ncbi:DUF2325 domain-containing protein [Uliginosibacterium aquaticum]|uniref:DUF2325 domain-containing protein n=1 Tax=Uliginosibacterium aquaticum TaxID=2731212 RepID=A0ABX2ILQ7_9RHOO|nr:DUF2325 domain-containing protein [Uliginosibacterium aquaticum]NSL54970.1 DUF2325 domain-containing protein [Uliginosibacterium aquaticum]